MMRLALASVTLALAGAYAGYVIHLYAAIEQALAVLP